MSTNNHLKYIYIALIAHQLNLSQYYKVVVEKNRCDYCVY